MENTVLPRRARLADVLASGHAGGTRLVLIAWVSTLALVATALLLGFLTPDFLLPFERPGTLYLLASCLLSLANSSVGALVVSRQPRNRVGWVFCSIGLLYGVRCLAVAYADYALLARPGLPLGELAAWASTWLRFPVVALVALVVLLFPDGRLPSSRWRPVVWTAGGGAVLVAFGDAFRFGPLPTYYYVNNPFGRVLPASSLTEASTILGVALLTTSCLASIVALALRLRRAHDVEHRHLRWFAYAAVPALLGSTLVLLNWGVERLGALFPGGSLEPVPWIGEHSILFADAVQTAGTLSKLRLDTNLELVGACTLLMVPVLAYVATRDHGMLDAGHTTSLPTRWWRVLFAGAIAGALPLAFVYLAVFLYVIFYPLVGGGEPEPEQLARLVAFLSGSGAHVFFFALTLLVAFRVARRAEERAVALGTVVGLVAAFIDRTIAAVIGTAIPPGEIASYLCLGLAGGYFGGLAGRSTLSGGVYRVSRQIGEAKDASTVAATIGDIGDKGIEGVAIWRKDNPENQGVPTDDYNDRPRTVLWGSWSLDGNEGWPSDLKPGEAGSAMLVAPGERSWAMVQRSTLAPEE